MDRKIRAVGPRGVIFISEATARNAKFLSKYGIRVEDETYSEQQPIAKTKIGKVVVEAEVNELMPEVNELISETPKVEVITKKKIKPQTITPNN